MKISINKDELLLLDWLLVFPMPCNQVDLDWHMKFAPFRLTIWEAIEKVKEEEVTIEVEDAGLLLAIVPTTFRWSPSEPGKTSPDCGFSLKQKLARALITEREENNLWERKLSLE